MIFEPCGDLLKDYSAFCESLSVTEREDVYSAILTRVVEVPPLPADELEASEGVGGGAGDALDRRLISATANAKGSRPSTKTASKEKEKASAGGKHKSLLKSSQEASTKPAEEETPPHLPLTPTITYVSLHYPVFCLNQRDMTPLSRAIPHCPSLLSVELIGCGLSAQSYMQLVEAVYRSPRVLSVAVDFNQDISGNSYTSHSLEKGSHASVLTNTREQAGFVIDPTLRNAASRSLGDALEMSVGGFCGLSFASGNSQERPFSLNTVPATSPSGTSAADAASSGDRNTSRVAGGDPKPAVMRNSRLSQSAAADASATVLTEAQRVGEAGDEDHSGGSLELYFYPTQFCGLDQLPTQLELQLQEETEKKGKVDSKRLQQVQAQRDTLRIFNRQNRMAVPKSWDGILFTGIRFLSLRGNGIDDAAVTRIVDVLKHNPRSQLESLNLWGNNITDLGATALAQLLRHNRDIRVLDVGNNRLSDTGLLELIDTLRMHQVSSLEEVLALRRAYLTRRGATDEERKAAGQPLLATDIPSYEDLYAYWWYTQQQLHQQPPPLPHATERGGAADATPQVWNNLSLSSALYMAPPPPPPQRDASLSPSSSSAKRASSKSKSMRSELVPGGCGGGPMASAAATLSSSAARAAMRPTVAFDRDCVRMCHLAENDPSIRVPGNTVLEVLNLEENRYVTIIGVREAARRLALHEPATTAEMLSMVEVREVHSTPSLSPSAPHSAASSSMEGASKRLTSAIHRSTAAASQPMPTPLTVIHPPELHCAGLRLRVCAVRCHRESDRRTWREMDEVQQHLNASLAQWSRSRAASRT
ncbi:hypothetical protein, conserved [Leishmania donovani]|uniref:Leucine Rich repeat family protein n=1 Tax=Leishmania donovani TaxID=5661 RepID=E9BP86_LEIDO|nr:hypothetical protein, conserved [Leishmania donovani]CBZ37064.1 hypothetical protein, conserved [Leishmania donovani]